MKKPIKKVSEPYWDYFEVKVYIESKYNVKLRDYDGKFSGNSNAEYKDFWHWICDMNDIHNGCFFELSVSYWYEEEETPDWIKEILKMFFDEFQEDDMRFWVCW